MAAAGKVQVKLFLRPDTHQALKDHKAKTGTSMSVAVEELVDDILVPELKERDEKSS